MRFIAISDTHDNLKAINDLINILKEEKFDFVVHAGDVISPFSLRAFPFKEMYIAFGNNDGDREKLLEIAIERGWKIGEIVEFPMGVIYHGTNERILKMLSKKYSLVITGHTHKSYIESGILNPGEICGYLTGKRSYAIVEDEEISIIEF